MTAADRVALARAVAKVAHDGQLRKGGEDFFRHPERVARKVGRLGADAVIVAYLHDVVEDTHITSRTIAELFNPEVFLDVHALSRLRTETYQEFIARTIRTGSDLALQVKLADLHDNMTDPVKVVKGKRYQLADKAIRAELERRGVTPLTFPTTQEEA